MTDPVAGAAVHRVRGQLEEWNAGNPAEMQAILGSLPMDLWMTVETTPLSQHPSDPALIIA